MPIKVPEINAFDIQGLQALNNDHIEKNTALKKAAHQFEGIFLRQLLASMRKVNDIFKKDSLFDSKSSDFYQGMWDDQMAIQLSKNSQGSIADLLVKQLTQVPMATLPHLHSLPVTSSHQAEKPQPLNNLNSRVEPIHHLNKMVKSSHNPSLNQVSPTSSHVVEDITTYQTPQLQPTEPQSFSSRQEFIDFMKPLVQEASQLLGIKPQFLMAQAALETGWGQHLIQSQQFGSSKNLFNIKNKSDWEGKTTTKVSVEFDGNKFTKKTSKFRVYDSFKQSIQDFVNFISSSSRYKNLLKTGQQMGQYLKAIQESGYATDPGYSQKLMTILKSNIMQKNF